MTNLRGWLRDRWGTLRGAVALAHPHLLRLGMRGKSAFFAYARPVFQSYIQSLHPHVKVVSIGQALHGIRKGSDLVQARLPRLEGYIGLSDWERVSLASLLASRPDHPCFEIGTAAGSTTLLLAANTRQTVYTLDLPDDFNDANFTLVRMHTDDQVIAGRVRAELIRGAEEMASNIVELTGDSARFDFTPYHGRMGLFFVDGAHSYEYVRSDTMHATRCLMEGGILAWHDFGSSRDVSRFLEELARAGCSVFAVERTTLAFSLDVQRIADYLHAR